jgi:hypothetical protein
MASSNPLGGSNFRESSRWVDCLSRLAIALLSAGSAYARILMKLQQFHVINGDISKNSQKENVQAEAEGNLSCITA